MHSRIRKMREDAGYSREKFAEMIGVSAAYLSAFERGKVGCSVITLKKICTVLGVSADYILFGTIGEAEHTMLNKVHRVDSKYMPLITAVIDEALILSCEK